MACSNHTAANKQLNWDLNSDILALGYNHSCYCPHPLSFCSWDFSLSLLFSSYILFPNELVTCSYILLLLLFSLQVVSNSFATPWTVAHQSPFPDPGIEAMSPALAGGFFTTELPGKPFSYIKS